MLPIITNLESRKILSSKPGPLNLSLDLGKSISTVQIDSKFVNIAGTSVPLADLAATKDDTCYVLEDGILKQVAFFAEDTSLYYKLLPTGSWPTITLSSTPMHRYIHITPKAHAHLMAKELAPIQGRVLDTCCGLGYTAILASKHAEVFTFEPDEHVLRIASFNPYSEELFSSKKIRLHEKDVFESIKDFHNNYFDRILHDPPTFKYAPELYSGEFYSELHRVLKSRGILYHYAPSPQKTHGRLFYAGILRRLKETGFKQVEFHDRSSGIRAVKL